MSRYSAPASNQGAEHDGTKKKHSLTCSDNAATVRAETTKSNSGYWPASNQAAELHARGETRLCGCLELKDNESERANEFVDLCL